MNEILGTGPIEQHQLQPLPGTLQFFAPDCYYCGVSLITRTRRYLPHHHALSCEECFQQEIRQPAD